ncbi:hypothetical protein T09_11898 [Trichinella sp. T9]|nr:hypothetical protein T09_11898 [Trichinella sp. T9]
MVHHDDWAGSTKISDLTEIVIIPLEIFTRPTDSWEGSVLPPARYLQPSPAAEVASTFRALRELPSTLASNETKAAVQQGQTTAVSSDWPTMMVPVGQGGQLSSNEEVCWGESQVVVCSVAYDRQRPIVDPGLSLA